MNIEEIYSILDELLKKVEDRGYVDTDVNYRCGEVDWFAEGILENFVGMIKKEIERKEESK